MPNGNPKFHQEEFPVLEAFFSTKSKILNEFGVKYNLKLEKYWHHNPSWRFDFQHPKGGVASIDVEKESDDSIKIYKYWWIDDYDKFTRFVKNDESKEIKISEVNLNFLESNLKEVLRWKKEEWSQIANDYEKIWKPYGREFIEKDVEKYPKLKM